MKYEKIVYSVKFLSFSLSLINIVDFDLEIIQVYVTSWSARIILFNFFFQNIYMHFEEVSRFHRVGGFSPNIFSCSIASMSS
jgi:hypothetical protein